MKFGIRLRVIKWLLDSCIMGCMDEYDDVPSDVQEGVAHLHSAIEGMVKEKDVTDPDLIARIRLLAKHGNCFSADDEWCNSGKSGFCSGCIQHCGVAAPDYWDCNKEGKSARRWLAEHGIKE